VELCREDGVVLGKFIPTSTPSHNEKWVPEFDEEEVKRQLANGVWYSTAEVLAHLKSLEQK